MFMEYLAFAALSSAHKCGLASLRSILDNIIVQQNFFIGYNVVVVNIHKGWKKLIYVQEYLFIR